MPLKDDVLISKTLLRRFEVEAELEGGDGRYYALMRLESGRLCAHHPFAPSAVADQVMWADDMLKLLNRELHHDGAWVIVFTHPEPPAGLSAIDLVPKHWDYRRYVMLWLDEDGDPQCPIEWTKGEGDLYDFTDVLLAGRESTAQKCEAAWQMWNTVMRQALDPAEGQTYQKAKGQLAPSTRH